jgi:dihydrofolate reductase
MKKVKLEIQVSIDGFAADRDGRSNWMRWNWGEEWTWDDALRHYHLDLTTSSDCILLSRKMAEEGFHLHWERVAEDSADPQYAFAKPITEMHKVVFSRSLDRSIWRNTEFAKGDLAAEVARLKGGNGKDIIVYGGPTFASSLLNAGLIDEFHLFVNPTVLGSGRSMFKDLGSNTNLKLLGAMPFDCGVVVIQYVRGG